MTAISVTIGLAMMLLCSCAILNLHGVLQSDSPGSLTLKSIMQAMPAFTSELLQDLQEGKSKDLIGEIDQHPEATRSHENIISKSPTADRVLLMELKTALQNSFEKLAIHHNGVSTAERQATLERKAEECAELIHNSMNNSNRDYHSVPHVFDVLRDLEHPVTILAAIFHDTVYHHVDGGFTENQAKILRGSIVQGEDQSNLLVHPDAYEDRLLGMVVDIMGFQPGQVVTPMAGINEFLSAVVAVRQLDGFVTDAILAQIIACIEATIPFRANNSDGTPADRLYQRLIKVNEAYRLGMEKADIIFSVQLAITVSNEDLANFSSNDPSYFLDKTWSLLAESNPSLRETQLFTVSDMMFAIFKMRKFFSLIKTDSIYHSFQGVPSDEELMRKKSQAGRNLWVGSKYINAKLLSLSFISAITNLTGEEKSMFELAGDVKHKEESLDFSGSLPLSLDLGRDCDEEVYKLLVNGRGHESSFDDLLSPLAAFFYSKLGNSGVESILDDEPVYPMDTEKAFRLLKRLKSLENLENHLKRFVEGESNLLKELMGMNLQRQEG